MLAYCSPDYLLRTLRQDPRRYREVCYTYPPTGSTTISRGLSKLSHTSTVLCVPSRLETSIRLVPASVQYNFRVTQSMARPAGLSRLDLTITYKKNRLNVKQRKKIYITFIFKKNLPVQVIYSQMSTL